ncbi:DUF3644 domain-containing protein [Candidatus Binatus sp.]|uniref:DUF3644 domain-containing protein n=1 Tax=Candidatus Binatus sp. TaxID=2811406 RepID=UPI00351D318F
MSSRLKRPVRTHLDKARAAAISAVEVYNRPGSAFRTPHYLVLMTIAWTALFHAIFYKNGQRPWHRKKAGKSFRYVQIDGEFKHWELEECSNQFWQDKNPPERSRTGSMAIAREDWPIRSGTCGSYRPMSRTCRPKR